MKIAKSASDQTVMKAKQPLLPLVPEKEVEKLDKSNSVTFELRTNPTDGNSPKYKFTCRVLDGSESVRMILQWVKDNTKVLAGLNVTAIGTKVTMTETMLKGTPLALYNDKIAELAKPRFDQAVEDAANNNARATVRRNGWEHYRETEDHGKAIQFVVASLVPKKALQKIKRSMRRDMRKPADMKVRTYFQHLIRINIDELPFLPPFNEDQQIAPDELTDIILYGCPKSWIREMDRQGIDPLEKTTAEVVDFLEQIEMSEDFEPATSKNTKQKGQGSGKSKSNNGDGNGQKTCIIHGKGSHSTDECRTVLAKLGKGSSDNGNKTWSRKAQEAKAKAKNDLKAYVQKAIREEVNSIAKKRKTSANDLNALEEEFDDIDLSKFDEDDIMQAVEGESEDDEISI